MSAAERLPSSRTSKSHCYVLTGTNCIRAVPKPRKRVSNAPSKPLSKVAATKAAAQRAASSSAANTSVTAGNTSTLSVSNLAAALPQPQPMLTAGAPVYPRTPTPPPHSAHSLPPISTPSNDPGFKPLSSFMSEAPSPMEGNTSVGMKRQRTETNGSAGNVTAPVGGKKARKTLVDTVSLGC